MTTKELQRKGVISETLLDDLLSIIKEDNTKLIVYEKWQQVKQQNKHIKNIMTYLNDIQLIKSYNTLIGFKLNGVYFRLNYNHSTTTAKHHNTTENTSMNVLLLNDKQLQRIYITLINKWYM